jgi:hypothetical protein
MKIKVTVTRERVVTETAQFDAEVPSYLHEAVRDGETLALGRSGEKQGLIVARGLAKERMDALEWHPGDAETRYRGVQEYEIIEG